VTQERGLCCLLPIFIEIKECPYHFLAADRQIQARSRRICRTLESINMSGSPNPMVYSMDLKTSQKSGSGTGLKKQEVENRLKSFPEAGLSKILWSYRAICFN